jgi:dTDP-glucose 4,6-dehydratase
LKISLIVDKKFASIIFSDIVFFPFALWFVTNRTVDSLNPFIENVWILSLIWLLIYLFCAFYFAIYSGNFAIASFEEFVNLTKIYSITTSFLLIWQNIFYSYEEMFWNLIITCMLNFMISLGIRALYRYSRKKTHSENALSKRALIYGAGQGGQKLVEYILTASTNFKLIGFLDDDISKIGSKICGLKVLGNVSDLDKIIKKFYIKTLVVAISNMPPGSLMELETNCNLLGVELLVIPTSFEISTGLVKIQDLEQVSDEIILGRSSTLGDDKQIINFIKGKRVLITGAGGSIGSEISKQIVRYGSESVTFLDRDENLLLELELSLRGTGLLQEENYVLGDIRDSQCIDEIFEQFKPEIVFHTAALKHLATLERFPSEAMKTNVFGTKNILEASRKHGVSVFVNISTDKAADPTSVLGHSKLTTERLTATFNSKSFKCLSVRFGNVIGSRGSFIHTFRNQIKSGGPVTVTDKNVTRFFMTVKEAVHLVLLASVIGEGGETLILDMGQPVKIDDIAKYLINKSGEDVKIIYTGLRNGEKLKEVLVSNTEKFVKSDNPLIWRTQVEPFENLNAI